MFFPSFQERDQKKRCVWILNKSGDTSGKTLKEARAFVGKEAKAKVMITSRGIAAFPATVPTLASPY